MQYLCPCDFINSLNRPSVPVLKHFGIKSNYYQICLNMILIYSELRLPVDLIAWYMYKRVGYFR